MTGLRHGDMGARVCNAFFNWNIELTLSEIKWLIFWDVLKPTKLPLKLLEQRKEELRRWEVDEGIKKV